MAENAIYERYLGIVSTMHYAAACDIHLYIYIEYKDLCNDVLNYELDKLKLIDSIGIIHKVDKFWHCVNAFQVALC
eukprot:6180863-Pleurochrysis_carterae.AAC.1